MLHFLCDDCTVENCRDKAKNQYEQEAQKIAQLVTIKQKQYRNSFGNADKIMKVLYPNGISHGNQGQENAFQDILGYSLLAVVRNKNEG